jgi:hypothetical protein
MSNRHQPPTVSDHDYRAEVGKNSKSNNQPTPPLSKHLQTRRKMSTRRCLFSTAQKGEIDV